MSILRAFYYESTRLFWRARVSVTFVLFVHLLHLFVIYNFVFSVYIYIYVCIGVDLHMQ